MSFRVLIVPEDPTRDRHILQPLVEAMMNRLGKSQAKVKVVDDPRVQGFADAKSRLFEIADRYKYYQLILFLVDADGNDRANEFRVLETARQQPPLVCCAGVEEVEAWLLAGHIAKLPAIWSVVRAEVSLKETYFRPFMKQYGDLDRPDLGCGALMAETLANYAGLLERCPELAELESRIATALP